MEVDRAVQEIHLEITWNDLEGLGQLIFVRPSHFCTSEVRWCDAMVRCDGAIKFAKLCKSAGTVIAYSYTLHIHKKIYTSSH